MIALLGARAQLGATVGDLYPQTQKALRCSGKKSLERNESHLWLGFANLLLDIASRTDRWKVTLNSVRENGQPRENRIQP